MRRHRSSFSVLALSCAACCAAPASGFIIDSSGADATPWQTTASGSRSGNGVPATLTWSIVPDSTPLTRDTGVGTASSNLISFMNSTFSGTPSQTNLTLQPWFHLFTDAFGRWAQLGGVNYVYEPHDDGVLLPSSNGVLGVRGDIRIGGYNIDGSGGTLAFTYIPSDGSDMVIDTSEGSFFGNSANNYVNFRDTVMHEIGHSFGLMHVDSTTDNLLMEPVINTSFDGPQLDEVRGVQYFFGDANDNANGGQGNGTSALATSLGAIPPGGTVRIGSAADVPTQTISASATDFVSISKASDIDFYSFSVSQPSLLAGTLTPRGGVFTQGDADAGQTPTTFNANARNNLALAIFGTDGTTVLATADANPAGGTESIANLFLPAAGTYFARVMGANNNVQLYELSLSAAAIPPGDFNHDGRVDAADYVLWRKSDGTQIGYNTWRTHFGEGGSSSATANATRAAVPEPSIVTLSLLFALGCFVSRECSRGRNS